jgi:hypothetical protein
MKIHLGVIRILNAEYQRAWHLKNREKRIEKFRWNNLISRCTNENFPSYKWYGARGITVCERWLGPDGYENFKQDMGPRPAGGTIDRIDSNGNYEPDNCRWATAKEQARNKRNTLMVEYQGRTMPLMEASEISGINYWTLRGRIANGDTGEFLFRPVLNRNLN